MERTPWLCLVAMPWSRKERPSAAVAALSAYVKRERPSWRVTSHSEFLNAMAGLGTTLYDALADDAYTMGELLYAAIIYPERVDAVATHLEQWIAARRDRQLRTLERAPEARQVIAALAAHVEELATRVAAADVVGLTTSFGQLFANLAVARAIKRHNPYCRIVLGGASVSARVGSSLLAEYPEIDAIVQGEGERPLIDILDATGRGEGVAGDSTAVLTRGPRDGSATFDETAALDTLPWPDYAEYSALAEQLGVGWALPVESSRGCWWDRTRRSGNPKATCYFCNLNVQWGGYRQKSPRRLIEELVGNAEKHGTVRAYFVDNILRHQGIEEFARGIQDTNIEFDLFFEMRAHIKPYDFLLMWEAGLTGTQFGVEGLSTAYLRRIGKGTTLLQNLQAMRLCAELGVPHGANLITHFPGATDEEIAECARTMLGDALAYEPLTLSQFHLGVGSTVDTLRSEFGITRVRNGDVYKIGLPAEVWERVELFDLDFDTETPPANWGPVYDAAEVWQRVHEQRRGSGPLLSYRDGASFVVVEDWRTGELRTGSFEGIVRDVFLECTELRTFAEIVRLCEAAGGDADDARTVLDHLVENKVVATEDDRFLTLPIAATPRAAARRIRAAHTRDSTRQSKRRALPVVA